MYPAELPPRHTRKLPFVGLPLQAAALEVFEAVRSYSTITPSASAEGLVSRSRVVDGTPALTVARKLDELETSSSSREDTGGGGGSGGVDQQLPRQTVAGSSSKAGGRAEDEERGGGGGAVLTDDMWNSVISTVAQVRVGGIFFKC